VARILLLAPQGSSFVELDRELLAERHEVTAAYGRRPRLRARAVWRAEVVFGWWAHFHTFLPFTLAWLLRRPRVLIVGGFDTASLPEIGYGNQRPGLRMLHRRLVSRWVMRRATVLATNSEYSRGELERNADFARARVTVIHHGVPDPFGGLSGEPERMALTVGYVDRNNLERKGLLPFVRAASELPDVRFVVIGPWVDDAADELRAIAGENVELAGFVEQAELHDAFRRAAVYVQASQHEGFGVSVAEAMLAGCVPVVTRAGALPEVVGDAGVVVEGAVPGTLATAVREALDAGPEARARARERVLSEFPVEGRRRGLWKLVERGLDEAG
jgi:glycosyltransferase involved in cell wall biosynthesis